ncbi:hypothetical protein CHS0354_035314 [Potamilus streckersoni]|uniref:Histidine kinase n=1 Tax=Potamilus streckersoni TaxID=2493646 RepID=A0AAE0VMZ9_9BIVA|nr:hypothetical protein CHS0354_035314 [Potamilus streckersoni]
MEKKELTVDPINLEEKELVSRVFKTFNTTIEKLRKFQETLEDQVRYLTNELKTTNREMQNILESLPNGLVVADLSGCIRSFNRAAEVITGHNRKEVIGADVSEIIHPSVLPPAKDKSRLKKIEAGYEQTLTLTNSDGAKQILETSAIFMQPDDEGGDAEMIIINIKDVTLLKRLEEEAERKNRLTAMGEIAANVAHEIRNPLGSIELFVSTLKMDFQDDEEKTEIMNHILTGIRSMNHIISNMLGYAKPRPIVPAKSLMREFIGFSAHLATYQEVKLVAEYQAEQTLVKGDREMLRQVMQNIFTNALQAMPDGGKLKISLVNSTEQAPARIRLFKTRGHELPQSLQTVSLIFQDEGNGMTAEVKRRIFDPFFTTKEKGTGLGMFIIRNIVSSHNGVIELDSEVGKGTTVSVIFPVLETGWREE